MMHLYYGRLLELHVVVIDDGGGRRLAVVAPEAAQRVGHGVGQAAAVVCVCVCVCVCVRACVKGAGDAAAVEVGWLNGWVLFLSSVTVKLQLRLPGNSSRSINIRLLW